MPRRVSALSWRSALPSGTREPAPTQFVYYLREKMIAWNLCTWGCFKHYNSLRTAPTLGLQPIRFEPPSANPSHFTPTSALESHDRRTGGEGRIDGGAVTSCASEAGCQGIGRRAAEQRPKGYTVTLKRRTGSLLQFKLNRTGCSSRSTWPWDRNRNARRWDQ